MAGNEDGGRLAGRVALVTGAGSGIGRAIATLFGAHGARVAVNDVSAGAAADTAGALEAEGVEALVVAADVASSEAVAAMFAAVDSRFGGLDVLVNNAGISEGAPGEQDRLNAQAEAVMADLLGGQPRRVHWDIASQITDESWDRMIAVHLSGTFYCCRSAIPLMARGGRGSIVNLSSVGAILGQPGVPHYSAAKAGILGLTRSLAGELGSRGIRVNAILPGTIDTPMTKPISPAFRSMVMMAQPIARLADPSEVASTALFLASDESSFYTGQALSPNGGIAMFS
ncbi:MAG TPA: SDR family NAD(P)-dependent oxidoreductase [Acidimicrobiia bacterium]|nr:SDR family NAD(P)-dependent oxidoreductase [Acidimicrobiia bacterium]